MSQKENKIVLYKDDEGKLSVNTLFADEDVWLTQEQLATIYQTTQENVSMHLSNIYMDKELEKERTYKKFLLVRQEGKRQVRRKHTGSGTLGTNIFADKELDKEVVVRKFRTTTQHGVLDNKEDIVE